MKGADQTSDDIRPFEVSHSVVLRLAVPMTLAYISTPLLGVVDTAVVGQFGDAALIGGLAVGAIIIDLVFTTFNFLRGGTTGLTAQAVGSQDKPEQQAVLFRALAIALVSGIVLTLLSPLLLAICLWFMEPGEAVSAAASTYFLIRMLSAPFALGNYAILGWLFGLGRSNITLALQLLLNGINIFLSIALGLWLEWQVTGIAMATVIGEAITFILGMIVCWRSLDPSERPTRSQFMQGHTWRKLANLNVDIMIRSFALVFAFTFFTAQGAKFGEVTLAANAILIHFFFVGAYFLDGMVSAVEQIAGRAVGARYRAGFWQGFWLTLLWNCILAVAVSFVFWVSSGWVIELLTTNEEVRQAAYSYLFWAVLIPITAMLAFQMDGVFIGATWTRDMTIMMIVSLAIYVASWHLLKDPLGNHGLWLAFHIFVIVRGVTLAARLVKRDRMEFGASA